MEYNQVHKEESWGSHGPFGIQISIAAGRELSSDEAFEISEYAAKIRALVMERTIKLNPKSKETAEKERECLMDCFPPFLYVDEIPNGYCSSYCCKHLPWFIVTTKIGRIKIGWRKRVIMIDWTDTREIRHGKELFPDEEVTKSSEHEKERYIHAYGYEKAKEYIGILLKRNTVACQ